MVSVQDRGRVVDVDRLPPVPPPGAALRQQRRRGHLHRGGLRGPHAALGRLRGRRAGLRPPGGPPLPQEAEGPQRVLVGWWGGGGWVYGEGRLTQRRRATSCKKEKDLSGCLWAGRVGGCTGREVDPEETCHFLQEAEGPEQVLVGWGGVRGGRLTQKRPATSCKKQKDLSGC